MNIKDFKNWIANSKNKSGIVDDDFKKVLSCMRDKYKVKVICNDVCIELHEYGYYALTKDIFADVKSYVENTLKQKYPRLSVSNSLIMYTIDRLINATNVPLYIVTENAYAGHYENKF